MSRSKNLNRLIIMGSYFKRDSYLLGGAIGIVLPAVALVIVAALFRFMEQIVGTPFAFEKKHLFLLSIMINLFPLRVYLVRFKYDKTGRGILALTFLYVIAFFLFLH